MTGSELLDELSARVAWAVLHSLWQGALLGAVAFVLLGTIRSAAARHAVGLVALLGLSALLVGNLARPLPAGASSVEVVAVATADESPAPVVVPAIEERTGVTQPPMAGPGAPLRCVCSVLLFFDILKAQQQQQQQQQQN